MDCPAPGEADWDAIYAEHLPRIYNYFRFRLAAEADVQDLTARVFEKAWSARGRYRRDVAAFSTWLYRIAQNVGVDYLRSRRTHAPLEDAVEVIVDGTPESDEEHRSDLARLAALTASLPDRERAVVWRRAEQSRDRAARRAERIECRHDPAPNGADVAVAMVTAESGDER
jgi:RNA polymerase sigma-70 factor (ECF subfamily)